MVTTMLRIDAELIAIWTFRAWLWEEARTSKLKNFPFREERLPRWYGAPMYLVPRCVAKKWRNYEQKNSDKIIAEIADVIVARQKRASRKKQLAKS